MHARELEKWSAPAASLSSGLLAQIVVIQGEEVSWSPFLSSTTKVMPQRHGF